MNLAKDMIDEVVARLRDQQDAEMGDHFKRGIEADKRLATLRAEIDGHVLRFADWVRLHDGHHCQVSVTHGEDRFVWWIRYVCHQCNNDYLLRAGSLFIPTRIER